MAEFDRLLDDLNVGLQAYARDAFRFPVAEELPPLPLLDHLTFARDDIPPPGALLLSADERIRLVLFNSLANNAVNLSGRILRPNGDLVTLLHQVTPTADRVASTFLFPGYEGALLSITSAATSSGSLAGTLWGQLGVGRGGDNSFIVTQLLAAGAITNRYQLFWPGGRSSLSSEGPGLIRSIAGTDPAAGVEISETVPTGARWRLRQVRATLVTDGAAATRIPRLLITGVGGSTVLIPPSATQTASLTRAYNGTAAPLYPATSATQLAWTLPPDLTLAAGTTITTTTQLLQAGDDWSAPVLDVEEWIEI